MADIQSNIKVGIDTTDALASIKNLQRQISAFHTSMAKGGAAANAVTAQLQQNLINSVNATGKFSAQMKTIRTTTESFTNSLEKNKFSLGEYFRYAGGASKTFGKLFKAEFETINKVARENVKDLQTQYIKMGRDANGAMKAIAVRPLSLDMNDLATKTMIASEKQALLNQLLKQGSTNLLNFGKNTQWAGRQLMVGFTIPLIAVGSQAAKTFMEMETQAIRFKKVYGDLFTPKEESAQALKDIQDLGKEFTKYGIAVSSTVGLASEAAAAGFKGLDLQRQTAAATKLSILGQVESQKALETTISLQNAFAMSSADLATNIDFLNAVENQTVLSLDDMSTAIPKAAPVIQQLGGDVKDLAFFMTAMKEGGINASEGANALKSGLASLINPTAKANDLLMSFGINTKKIVESNRGDLKKTVIDFASALNQLDPLNRAQAIEQMFGKFQFARLSTLFANVTKEGTQASRVLDLAGSSVQDLAALSEKELGMTSESAMNKFKAAVENLKVSLVPLGEQFLKAVTPIAEFVTKILDKFNNLGDGTKKIIVTMTAIVAGLGPVLLMTFGLLANGLANIIKGFTAMKTLFNRTGESSATLGTEVRYMTTEQRNAAAVASSLDQVHRNLAQTFTSEAAAVDRLVAAYGRAIAAQRSFVPTGVPMGRGPVTKRSKGKPVTVGGTGNQDTELALLTPGETVIPADMSNKYGGLINGMIADNIPGYIKGKRSKKTIAQRTQDVPVYGDLSIFIQDRAENQSQGASAPGLEQVLAPLVARVGEARGLGFSQQTQVEHYPGIIEEYRPLVQTFVDTIDTEMTRTADTISSENERLARAWQTAGTSVEQELAAIPNEVERGRVRQALGLEPDSYGSVAGDFRGNHGWGGRTARYAPGQGPTSYMDPNYRKGTSAAYEILTGNKVDPNTQDYGHPFDVRTRKKLGLPTTIPLEELRRDARTNSSTISTINNSIAREEEKAARNRTVGQATETTEEAVTAVRRTARTASPSKRTIPVGEDIARGLSAGMKKETPKVVAEANKMTDAAIKGTRTRRSASRPQGAPTTVKTPGKRVRRGAARAGGTVGPNGEILPSFVSTPDNARMLPIVSRPEPAAPPTRTQRLMAGAKGVGGRMNSLGGGMGLLGANMALGMAPDFAGKGVVQSAMTGANLGMMFGPWGMAAGASIGVVTSAISALIEKEKEHQAVAEATFKASADVAKFFGTEAASILTPIANIANDLSMVAKAGKDVKTSLGLSATEISNFKQMLDSLPKENPLATIVRGISDESNPEKIKQLGQSFVTMQIALGQIKPEDGQKLLDLILTASGKSDMVGALAVNIKTQAEAIRKSIDGSATSFSTLKLTISQTMAAAANSTSLEQLQVYLDGIAASGYNGAAGINALRQSFIDLGNVGAANLVSGLARRGLNTSQISAVVTAVNKGLSFNAKGKSGQDILKLAQDFNKKAFDVPKAGAASTNPYKSQTDSLSGQNKIIDAQIKALEKRKKLIDEEIAAQKKITSELKRQHDFEVSQAELESKIVDAKIRGNYIEAANLKQQQINKAVEYKQEGALTPLEDKSAALQKEIDALKEKKDANSQTINSNNVNSNNTTTTTNNYASPTPGVVSGMGEGSFKTPIATKSLKEAYQNVPKLKPKVGGALNPGLDPSKWNQPLLGGLLGAASARSQIKKYAEEQFIQPGQYFTLDHNGLRYKFRVEKDKNITMIGKPVAIVKEKGKANGGLIKGPGTGRSDSIRATLGYAGGGSIRVSNGEFVVKESSVRDYGIAKMNAINNGTAEVSTNSGGTVYNINMPITSNNASAAGVADEVMRRLKVELNKNNKSNAVRI